MITNPQAASAAGGFALQDGACLLPGPGPGDLGGKFGSQERRSAEKTRRLSTGSRCFQRLQTITCIYISPSRRKTHIKYYKIERPTFLRQTSRKSNHPKDACFHFAGGPPGAREVCSQNPRRLARIRRHRAHRRSPVCIAGLTTGIEMMPMEGGVFALGP